MSPHIHQRNTAERAIRTFKNHFIAGLYSTDPNFPTHLWDKLLLQAEITLNLLRQSRVHPHLSSLHTSQHVQPLQPDDSMHQPWTDA